MTDAPALTPRTAVASHDSRSDEVIALKRELAAALADRNALQLTLNAANGRADASQGAVKLLREHNVRLDQKVDGLEVALRFIVKNDIANLSQRSAHVVSAALSATPESPYKAALRTLVAKLDAIAADPAFKSVWALHHVHGGRYDGPTWTAELDAGRTLLADPQPDTKEQRIEEPKL